MEVLLAFMWEESNILKIGNQSKILLWKSYVYKLTLSLLDSQINNKDLLQVYNSAPLFLQLYALVFKIFIWAVSNFRKELLFIKWYNSDFNFL